MPIWIDGRKVTTAVQYELHYIANRLRYVSNDLAERPVLVSSGSLLSEIDWCVKHLEGVRRDLSDGEDYAETDARLLEDAEIAEATDRLEQESS